MLIDLVFMNKILILSCMFLLTSCQMVTIQELAYIQSVHTSKTNSQKIFINMFDTKKDKILYQISRSDFNARYSNNKNWKYLEITKIENIGPQLDEYLKQGKIDELVLNAHGNSFVILVGKQKLTKSKIKKINFKGSLEPNSKIFLLSCTVGQRSMFQLGTPFVKKLGQVFLKQKGTIYASTKLVNYPNQYIDELGVKRNYDWYEYALSYLMIPFSLPTRQYITWSPWDNYRVREIRIY